MPSATESEYGIPLPRAPFAPMLLIKNHLAGRVRPIRASIRLRAVRTGLRANPVKRKIRHTAMNFAVLKLSEAGEAAVCERADTPTPQVLGSASRELYTRPLVVEMGQP